MSNCAHHNRNRSIAPVAFSTADGMAQQFEDARGPIVGIDGVASAGKRLRETKTSLANQPSPKRQRGSTSTIDAEERALCARDARRVARSSRFANDAESDRDDDDADDGNDNVVSQEIIILNGDENDSSFEEAATMQTMREDADVSHRHGREWSEHADKPTPNSNVRDRVGAARPPKRNNRNRGGRHVQLKRRLERERRALQQQQQQQKRVDAAKHIEASPVQSDPVEPSPVQSDPVEPSSPVAPPTATLETPSEILPLLLDACERGQPIDVITRLVRLACEPPMAHGLCECLCECAFVVLAADSHGHYDDRDVATICALLARTMEHVIAHDHQFAADPATFLLFGQPTSAKSRTFIAALSMSSALNTPWMGPLPVLAAHTARPMSLALVMRAAVRPLDRHADAPRSRPSYRRYLGQRGGSGEEGEKNVGASGEHGPARSHDRTASRWSPPTPLNSDNLLDTRRAFAAALARIAIINASAQGTRSIVQRVACTAAAVAYLPRDSTVLDELALDGKLTQLFDHRDLVGLVLASRAGAQSACRAMARAALRVSEDALVDLIGCHDCVCEGSCDLKELAQRTSLRCAERVDAVLDAYHRRRHHNPDATARFNCRGCRDAGRHIDRARHDVKRIELDVASMIGPAFTTKECVSPIGSRNDGKQ